MNYSLKVKLILSYVLLSLFLVSALLFVSNYFLEKKFQSYIIDLQDSKNNNIVQMVADSFGQNEELPDDITLQNIGNTALTQGLVLMVNRADGQQIFCMSDNDAQSCNDMIDSMSTRMASVYPHFKGEYEQKEYPVTKGGIVVGTVTLGYFGPFYYNEEDVAFLHMLNHIFWGVGILFLLIAAALGYIMANRISRPIKKVIEQTKQIEEGNYQERLILHSNTKELKQLIRSVNALAVNLERQQQSKKQMARNYAHEFRTPLATLQLNLEAMIDGIYEPNAEQLESCLEEILRLTRMVADIDKIVKIENDTAALQKSNFDLTEVVNQTILNFAPAMASKNITVEKKLSSCMCYADQDKITQTVVNLLSNAYKYTRDGGKIMIMVSKDKSFANLSVADNGVGIAKEELPYIWEYLYRGDQSRDRKTGGTGIGLSVVKAIIEAHGGQLEVNSELEKGSEFIIRIPR